MITEFCCEDCDCFRYHDIDDYYYCAGKGKVVNINDLCLITVEMQ